MSEAEQPDEAEYGLVILSVASKSNGGPYDDEAFCAGVYAGKVWAALEAMRPVRDMVVPTPLVPELDLYAAHFGMVMDSEAWDVAPDEWTYVTMRAEGAAHV